MRPALFRAHTYTWEGSMARAEIIQVQFGGSSPAAKKGGAGGERLKRRPDGLYQLEKRYVLPDGTHKRKSFYGSTQAEVQEKRRAFEAELESGANVTARDVLVRDYAQSWLKLYKSDVKPHTYMAYAHNVALIVGQFGGKRMRDVQASDIRALLNTRAGLSKGAIRQTRMTASAIFEQAISDRILSYNPVRNVDGPKGEEGTHRPLEAWEREMILNPPAPHRFQLAMLIMLFAGLRRSEVLALDLERDVDLAAGVIHVREGLTFPSNQPVIDGPKTKTSVRDVPILPPLDQILAHTPLHGPAAPSAQGGHMSASSFKSTFSSYRTMMETALNGVAWGRASAEQRAQWRAWTVRCHDLRHTFCTMLYDAGVDVKTTQRWLGHSDIQTTMRIYTHLSAKRLGESTEKARDHFSEIAGKGAGKSEHPMKNRETEN